MQTQQALLNTQFIHKQTPFMHCYLFFIHFIVCSTFSHGARAFVKKIYKAQEKKGLKKFCLCSLKKFLILILIFFDFDFDFDFFVTTLL
jgi:hypothetical protein